MEYNMQVMTSLYTWLNLVSTSAGIWQDSQVKGESAFAPLDKFVPWSQKKNSAVIANQVIDWLLIIIQWINEGIGKSNATIAHVSISQ